MNKYLLNEWLFHGYLCATGISRYFTSDASDFIWQDLRSNAYNQQDIQLYKVSLEPRLL